MCVFRDKAVIVCVCVQEVISRFGLRQAAGAQHQTYALGIKEVGKLGPGTKVVM